MPGSASAGPLELQLFPMGWLMPSIIYHLIKLQQVDDLSAERRKSIKESETKLSQIKIAVEHLEATLVVRQQEQAQRQARHRELEASVVDFSERRQKNESRQLMIANTAEYEALIKEAGFLTTSLDDLENQTLELLDLIDVQAKELSKETATVAEQKKLAKEMTSQLEVTLKSGQERLAELDTARALQVAALPPANVAKYEELFRLKGGRAVASGGGGLCQACRLSFPPQFSNELQHNEEIIYCPNCYRIIYWPDHPDFQDPA